MITKMVRMRRQALWLVFASSRLWQLAQALPMPARWHGHTLVWPDGPFSPAQHPCCLVLNRRVAGIIFVESVLTYTVVAANKSQIACTLVTGPGANDPVVRVFQPLRYIYWLTTTPPLIIMLGKLASIPDRLIASGAICESLVILFGLLSTLCGAFPGAFWFFFLCALGCFVWVNYVMVCSLLGAHGATMDKATQHLLNVLGPLAMVSRRWIGTLPTHLLELNPPSAASPIVTTAGHVGLLPRGMAVV